MEIDSTVHTEQQKVGDINHDLLVHVDGCEDLKEWLLRCEAALADHQKLDATDIERADLKNQVVEDSTL